METKEQKLAKVDELVKNLGLTNYEVVDYFSKIPSVSEVKEPQSKIDICQVKPGMIWYEDDTFSFERLTGKKIKAIVELVDNGVIYGDLTVSEVRYIPEKYMTWYEAKDFFQEGDHRSDRLENFVWYNRHLLRKVHDNYNAVKKAFEKLHKPCRKARYWSSSDKTFGERADILDFSNGNMDYSDTRSVNCVRPIIAKRIE